MTFSSGSDTSAWLSTRELGVLPALSGARSASLRDVTSERTVTHVSGTSSVWWLRSRAQRESSLTGTWVGGTALGGQCLTPRIQAVRVTVPVEKVASGCVGEGGQVVEELLALSIGVAGQLGLVIQHPTFGRCRGDEGLEILLGQLVQGLGVDGCFL
jgi:hypothetical protein